MSAKQKCHSSLISSTLFVGAKQLSLLSMMSLLLAACGGGGGDDNTGTNPPPPPPAVTTYTLGGAASGLTGTVELSVTTSTGSPQSVSITSDGTFNFANAIEEGANYSISISSQPVAQSCFLTNGSGTINDNISNVQLTCNGFYTLSGTLKPAAAIDYDSDVNDPFTPGFAANNSINTAQSINNIVTVHGFASEVPGSTVPKLDATPGNFNDTPDVDDFFQVSLQANQKIQLQIVDYENFGSVSLPFSGDLDLYVYDENGDLAGFSNSTTEFESFVTLISGNYYLRINAFSGISKYILSITPPGVGISATDNTIPVGNIIPNEAIVKFNDVQSQLPNTINGQSLSIQTKNIELNRQRPLLAKLSSNNRINTRNAVSTNNVDAIFSTVKAVKELRQRKDVEFAELNYRLTAHAIPDDDYYNFQWHYPQMDLPQAWDVTTGATSGAPVIVAVIDTGIVLNHPDFQNQLVAGYDFISDPTRARDGDGIDSNPDDPGDSGDRGKSSWHGTHVGGTIAARTDDNNGVAGVAWDAKLMPLRVLGVDGGSSYDIQQAMLFAAGLENDSGTLPPQKADIINMSLGGGGFLQSTQNIIDQVRAAGVIVIASAGNDGTSELNYPASYDGVISVSATDFNKDKAGYSNFGTAIDVAAPGGDVSQDLNNDGYGDGVLSAVVDDTSGIREPAWSFYQGTSMAAPHVAGVVALMKAVYPALTPEEFDTVLQSGTITEDIGSAGWDNQYGYGFLNASLAVNEAARLNNGGTPPPAPPRVVASPSFVVLGLNSNALLDLTNMGGGLPLITGINSTAPWLSITAQTVDANNLGTYSLAVDRTGLGDGIYQSTIEVAIDGTPSLSLPVTMQVGSVTTAGKLHRQYLLLIDTMTDEAVDATSTTNNSYQFSDVPPGDYIIFSGSDIDNDQFLCHSGESCGVYPSFSERETISVTSDLSNLDITVDILGGISTNGATAANASVADQTESTSSLKLKRPVSQPQKNIAQ